MTADDGEILSAFADGEVVDPTRFEAVLRDPGAVPLLVTCARLRAEIGGDTSRPSTAFYERMHMLLRPRGLRRFVRAAAIAVPWPIAAGAAAATLIGGIWAGLWVGTGPIPAAPPAVTVMAPATTPGPARTIAPALPSPGAGPQVQAGPPRPTQVLRFGTPGEWREGL
jgi:hypothetical protein